LLVGAAGLAFGGLEAGGSGGRSSGRDAQSKLAVHALQTQLAAIAAHDFGAACAGFSLRFFVLGGSDPARCVSTLSGQFGGREVVYRIRVGSTYTETKAIVVFEIAVGKGAASCRTLWRANTLRTCAEASDFAAILVREKGTGWRIAALNSI
jgi:hypothetical protein